jgi:hypothetical protein
MKTDRKRFTGKEKTAPKSKVQGEGDYEAARHYDEKLEKFVAEKKSEIPKMAKDAEKALDGPQGDELRRAEEKGKSKARR